jgi:hypothetical protein
MKTFHCGQVEELLDLYAANECNAHESKTVRLHLAGCPSCQDRLDQAREFMGLLDLHHGAAPALARLHRRIEADARPRSAGRRMLSMQRFAAVAALLLVTFGLGVWLPTSFDPSPSWPLELAIVAGRTRDSVAGVLEPGETPRIDLEGRVLSQMNLALEKGEGGDLPLPPRVNLLLVLHNPNPFPLVVERKDIGFTLHGQGVRSEKGPPVSARIRSETIAPQGDASVRLERLESRIDGKSEYLYPTRAGEYTVLVHLGVWVWREGLPKTRQWRILTSGPMKLRLDATR